MRGQKGSVREGLIVPLFFVFFVFFVAPGICRVRFWTIDVASPLSPLSLGCGTPACPAGRQAGRRGMAVILQHRGGGSAKRKVALPWGGGRLGELVLGAGVAGQGEERSEEEEGGRQGDGEAFHVAWIVARRGSWRYGGGCRGSARAGPLLFSCTEHILAQAFCQDRSLPVQPLSMWPLLVDP